MGFTSYRGPPSSFPGMDTWIGNWVDLFNIFKPGMLSTGNTGEDVGRIFNAIGEAAKIGVDERVILCIIIQESSGNVGVITTTAPDGSHSAGLMQCDGSPGFPGQHGLSQVCQIFYFLSLIMQANSPPGPNHQHDYGGHKALQGQPRTRRRCL